MTNCLGELDFHSWVEQFLAKLYLPHRQTSKVNTRRKLSFRLISSTIKVQSKRLIIVNDPSLTLYSGLVPNYGNKKDRSSRTIGDLVHEKIEFFSFLRNMTCMI
jgi:hypothetical protein